MAEGKMLYLQAQEKQYSSYQKERLFRLASERFKAGKSFFFRIFYSLTIYLPFPQQLLLPTPTIPKFCLHGVFHWLTKVSWMIQSGL